MPEPTCAYLAVALRAEFEPHDHSQPGVASDEPRGFVNIQVSVGASGWHHALSLPVSCDQMDDDLVARCLADWLASRVGAGHAHTIR
jgi:hypothetical protein